MAVKSKSSLYVFIHASENRMCSGQHAEMSFAQRAALRCGWLNCCSYRYDRSQVGQRMYSILKLDKKKLLKQQV